MTASTSRWLYLVLFITVLVLVLYLLYTPFMSYFFYPFDYQEEIYYYSNKHQVDPYLVAAVVNVESGFDPEAESPRGALGLMQIMPRTGEWAAGQTGMEEFEKEMLLKPSYNLDLGIWYLSYLLQEFDSNQTAALAAYNGGQGKVKSWMQSSVWDGEEQTVGDIPFRETREYVRKVKQAHERYMQLY